MRIAINYFRTALGVGLSLMTMELIISLGTQFLQNLVQQTANSTDLGQMLALTVAVILLGVLAHRIPQMISGMVTGSGHNGSIGAAGLMSAIGAAFAASNIARGLTAGGAGAAAAAGSMNDHHAKLLDRLSVLSEASGAVNGSETSTRYNSGGTGETSAAAPGGTGAQRSDPGQSAGLRWPGDPANLAGGKSSPKPTTTLAVTTAESTEPQEPTADRPMTPDEQRGFDANGNKPGEDS